MTELIGYAASALVAVSLLTSNVLRLRVLNLAGAAVFVLYAALTRAWPVLAVNLFVAAIDLWHIISLKSKKDIFKLMRVNTDNPLLANFLAYHARGIWQFFPDFDITKLSDPRCIFILRNLLPVGLFIYTEERPDIRVHLDYVAEDYRDLKSARYLFNRRRCAAFLACAPRPSMTEMRRLASLRYGYTQSKYSPMPLYTPQPVLR